MLGLFTGLWSIATSRLAGPIAAVGALALGVMLLGARGHLATETRRADRAEAAARTWLGGYTAWHTYGLAEKTAFAAAETRRTSEQARAEQGAATASRSCQARVDEARRSSSALSVLLNQEPARVPSPNPDGTCPVRVLLGSDSLRDALQPARASAPPGR